MKLANCPPDWRYPSEHTWEVQKDAAICHAHMLTILASVWAIVLACGEHIHFWVQQRSTATELLQISPAAAEGQI